MALTYRILFNGQILPGHDASEARSKLAALFKLDSPEKIEALFSGKPVSLRKGLSAADLPRYLARLEQIGLHVRSEQELPAALELAPAAPQPATPQPPSLPMGAGPETEASTPAPDVEIVTCPHCGEMQAKRTLCRSCGTDMPRMLAARKQQEADARTAREEARTAPAKATKANPYGEPAADQDFDALLFGFGFRKRHNRVSYLVVNLFCIALLFVSAALSFRLLSPWPILGGTILAVFFAVRSAALRFHDTDQSGWMAVLAVTPYVNVLCSLYLVIARGSEDDNRFGPPPAARSAALVVIALVSIVAGMFTMGRDALLQGPLLIQEFRNTGGFDLGKPKIEGTGSNEVILYVVDNDEACVRKARELHEAGIVFFEQNVETNEEAYRDMIARAQAAGLGGSGMNFPVVYVNGYMLPDDPSTSTIRRYLRDGKT